MSAPIPEDLQELHASTAEWDGSLMVKFAQTHGIELPWQCSPDAAVRRCLIERVALSTAENTYLFKRIAALEAQNQQLREALVDAQPFVLAHSAVHACQSGRPIGDCHPVHQEIIDKVAAALAATEPK